MTDSTQGFQCGLPDGYLIVVQEKDSEGKPAVYVYAEDFDGNLRASFTLSEASARVLGYMLAQVAGRLDSGNPDDDDVVVTAFVPGGPSSRRVINPGAPATATGPARASD